MQLAPLHSELYSSTYEASARCNEMETISYKQIAAFRPFAVLAVLGALGPLGLRMGLRLTGARVD